MSSDLEALKRLGLSESKAEETVKNDKIKGECLALLDLYGEGDVAATHGSLMYSFASKRAKSKFITDAHRGVILAAIKRDDIKKANQLDAAIAYFKTHAADDTSGFNEACGVGVEYSDEEISTAISAALDGVKAELTEKRYWFNTGPVLGALKKSFKWADAKALKDAVDAKIAEILGPKTKADEKRPPKKKQPKAKGDSDAKKDGGAKKTDASVAGDEEDVTFHGASSHFHAVGENDKTDGYVVTPNTARLLAEHKKAVNNTVHTRFPPEPNGILHIGHAKAINFNFNYAKERNGNCFLRYDDTNPEKEEQEYVDGILRDVRWLGHEPFRITYSSDYFQELYEAAVELTRRGLAYVCHQDSAELKGHVNRKMSPWRDRPVEESLKLFEDMKNGLIDEGKATLRMKHIMEDGKLDPVAYRIKFAPHHRTGDAWCIYPTYDFTHCLCDSIENITHSLCTKEFQNRRSSYYWLCNALDWYCPVQWEYSRLNVAYALVSKRKIGRLIDNGYVRGWDDPRLFTIAALRRRGFPPEAINNFCALVGVTENSNSTLSPVLLEACVRNVLNVTAKRVMAVLNPVKVVIESGDIPSTVEVPNNPVAEDAGTHSVPMCSVIYIDRDDFMETPEKGYRRLTLTQPVGLKAASLVATATSFKTGADGKVAEITVKVEPLTSDNKPKAFIHWVSSATPDVAPRSAEVNIHHQLFLTENPEEGKDMEKNLNKHSLDVYDALIDAGVDDLTAGTVYQFERIGFFVVDPDTKGEDIIFNRTVALREDKGKKGGK